MTYFKRRETERNLKGTLDVASDFLRNRQMTPHGGEPLQIMVVPSRIEQGEPEQLANFLREFDDLFRAFTPTVLQGLSPDEFSIPYQARFAFEEAVVTDPAERSRTSHLGSAFDRLADALR